MTTIDLDGVILVHKFTCQRCEQTDEFTEDQLKELEQSHMWRQFGFAPIGAVFRPGVLCGDCVKDLVRWWESRDDSPGPDFTQDDTTIPMTVPTVRLGEDELQ